MPNVTISLDDDLLKFGRRYAEEHGTSLNALIRKLIESAVASQSRDWIEECFRLMDQANVSSDGRRWHREDLYDV
ncbi:MAG: DUF6364 family protein [Planctomycetota bacterium]